jgi:hypothetical protein
MFPVNCRNQAITLIDLGNGVLSVMAIYHQLSQLIALPTSSDAFLMADWLVQEPS